MVVDAATIAVDSIDIFIEKLQQEGESNEYLNKLKETEKYEIIRKALVPKDYNLMVTPKEVDGLIENMKDVITRRNKFCSIGTVPCDKMSHSGHIYLVLAIEIIIV